MPQLGEIKKGTEVGYKHPAKHIWKACPECGKKRWVRIVKGIPQAKLCHQCNSERGEYVRGHKNHNWKGGNIHCSNGYIKLYQPTHHRRHSDGYVYEHILVWEKVHNKPLPKGWLIHHLNGIKNDNRPINLMAMPSKKHLAVLSEKAKRIRALEEEVKMLERALSESQMIFRIGEN